MEAILEKFIQETKDNLEHIEEDLLHIQNEIEHAEPECINRIFAILQGIGGGSSFFGLKNIGNLSYSLAAIMDGIRKKELTLSREIMENFFMGFYSLLHLTEDVHKSDQKEISDLLEILSGELKELALPITGAKDNEQFFLLDPQGNRWELEVDILDRIKRARKMYLLKYDLKELEQEKKLSPLNLIKKLTSSGEIVSGQLEIPDLSLEDGLPSQLNYEVLYSSPLTPLELQKDIGLPEERVIPMQICAENGKSQIIPEDSQMKSSVSSFVETSMLETSESARERQNLENYLKKLSGFEEFKRNFFILFAHEIQTPLEQLSNSMELLNVYLESLGEDRYLAWVLQKAVLAQKELNYRFTDLIDFENFKNTPAPQTIERFFLRQAVELAKIDSRNNLKEGVEFFNRVPETMGVFQNRMAVMKILTKLLDNSFEHTTEGKVEVTAEIIETEFILKVLDTGCGIPGVKKEKLLTALNKETDAPPENDIQGMGLTLCSRIISSIGGKLELKSENNGSIPGTEITIVIPQLMTIPT
ncbi:ATP-binding protein [Candidatus Riflebacteria bacterium]